ncbi:MAG: hypothetical protein Q8K59_08825 [Nitrosomonas sp.]|nr:hypothetical protein [Nitrosomonas sp.]MDP1951179.1 hypothetical protein [Nitrosomonas sp.]
MKRLSKQTRWWLIQLSRVLKRKLTRELIRKRRYKKRRTNSNTNTKSTIVEESISAPRAFNIEDKKTRKHVIKFLHDLRKIFARSDIQKVIIDFTNTDKFIADATLLFYAELSHLIGMKQNGIVIKYRPPINDRASEVLHQIGFYTMCGGKTRKRSTKNYDDVVHWRVAQGSVVDNSICADAIEKYEGQLAEPLINGLFRGLGEAMTNTIHHAYINTRDDGLNYSPPTKNWWMFSQARNNYLSVVFCDLGIGIPNTLPIQKPYLFKILDSLGMTGKDSEYIKIAIEDKRTRTNQPERGKGLGDIVDVITKQNSGTVRIHSNSGIFIKDETRTVTRDLKESILGTLIYWRVPLTNEPYRERENN